MLVLPTTSLLKCAQNNCMYAQITGKELQDMSLEVVRDMSPKRTRAECKLLVRRVIEVQDICQVSACMVHAMLASMECHTCN